MKSKIKWRILFAGFIMLHITKCFSQISNIKTNEEYPIDDPRNPNCPCHKIQQLANQEYQLNYLNIQNKIGSNGHEIKNPNYQRHVALNSEKLFSRSKKTALKSKRKYTLFARLMKRKNYKGRERKQRSVGVCFSWV
jgi:GR25 family glycosyltransferase involved in LPS biosynthesis